MTFEETLKKIDTYQRFSRKPGLERMATLLSRLGNPQEKLKFIHVAGTNGKGTACTLLSSVLTAAGYRTGLYLSPHVSDFRERIQFCGGMIPREELVSAAEKVFAAVDLLERDGVCVNVFELVTAIAMLWFSKQHCDAVVLEVGLGGRYDATNVIRGPLAALIMSISYDHTEVLGNTLTEIAHEKCGIFKPECPAVCSPGEPEEALREIRRSARETGSPLTEASCADLEIVRSDLTGTELRYRGGLLKLPFLGEHQVKNAATVLSTIEILRRQGMIISAEAVRTGFALARLPARLEVLSADPPVLVDGAHNPGGTAALAAALRRYLPGRKITAVMGMMADKDTASAVKNLSGLFSRVIAAAPLSPRAMRAEDFAALWRREGVEATAVSDEREALCEALSALREGSALVVCGSLYLAGEMRGPLLDALNTKK